MLPSSRYKWLNVVLASTLLVQQVNIASADVPATTREQARTLYNQGLELRDAGKAREAAEKLQAAFASVPSPIIGLDLAKTRVSLGQLAEAREVLLTVQRSPVLAVETDNSKSARAASATLLSTLEQRVPKVRLIFVGVPKGETPAVSIDGAPVESTRVHDGARLNVGKHVVTATLAGRSEVTRSIEIHNEGDRQDLTLEFAIRTSDHGDGGNSGLPDNRRISPIVYAGFGVAGAGIAVGAITGFMARSKVSTLDANCRPEDGACPASQADTIDSSKQLGTVSTISFAVAGAGVVLGVVGLLGFSKAPPREAPRASVTPWIGLGSAGVSGAF